MTQKSNGSNIAQLSVKQRRIAQTMNEWQMLIQKLFSTTVEVQKVRYFLVVASSEEPIEMNQIGKALGLSPAATSRNYYSLADGAKGEPGLDYLKVLVDYNDRRRRPVTLTEKGLAAAEELLDFINRKGALLTND